MTILHENAANRQLAVLDLTGPTLASLKPVAQQPQQPPKPITPQPPPMQPPKPRPQPPGRRTQYASRLLGSASNAKSGLILSGRVKPLPSCA